MNHIFLTAPTAQKLWKCFVSCARFNLEGSQVITIIIKKWWKHAEILRGRKVLNVVPVIIIWELWKRRNSIRHSKETSFERVLHICLKIIEQMICYIFLDLYNRTGEWTQLYDLMHRYRPKLSCNVIK